MSRSWSLQRFRSFLWKIDPCSAERASSAANALVREVHFASFHAWQARDLIEAARQQHDRAGDGPGMTAFRQFMREFEAESHDRPLLSASFMASAHATAFFRSCHAATDLLGPLIYWGLDLERILPKPIPLNAISPSTVRDALNSHRLYPKIAAAIDRLMSLPPYRYIRAFSNTTKHRELIPTGFTIAYDFTHNPKTGVRVGAFSYDRQYSAVWVDEFIDDEFKLVVSSIITVGRSVNAALASIQKS